MERLRAPQTAFGKDIKLEYLDVTFEHKLQ